MFKHGNLRLAVTINGLNFCIIAVRRVVIAFVGIFIADAVLMPKTKTDAKNEKEGEKERK